MSTELVLHRPMQAGDEGYIFSTWMQWARANRGWLRQLPNHIFLDDMVGYRAHVAALLRRGRVLVACDPESPEFILGYAIAEGTNVLHAVYVDKAFRKRGDRAWGVGVGLVRALLPKFGEAETVVTMDRPMFGVLSAKYRLRFDPFATKLVGLSFARWAHGLRASVANFGGAA